MQAASAFGHIGDYIEVGAAVVPSSGKKGYRVSASKNSEFYFYVKPIFLRIDIFDYNLRASVST